MTSLFLSIYDYFKIHKAVCWSVFILALIFISIGASRITLEEDITKFFPDDKRVEKLNYVFKNSKFVDRLVVMVSMEDSAVAPQPDSLVAVAQALAIQFEDQLKPYVKKITSTVDDEKILQVFTNVYDYLPIFLTDEDYAELDTLSQPEKVMSVLEANYRQLISPAGVAVKKIIVKDPLGFSYLALRKLKELQYDENFELYDGYIITKDHRHIIFFVQPLYPASDTGANSVFISQLHALTEAASASHTDVAVSYFGAVSVGVGNAVQLRSDSILTLTLMVFLLGILLIGFFKKKRIPFLILVPVAFGFAFALCCIYLLKGSISVLAIAAGSVILGIAINYSLHFLTHLKHTHDVREVLRDLVSPMTLGSMTTVAAFFCLQFANAAVLRDVGLFAGFSLIGAALCSLVFLPHFIDDHLFGNENKSTSSWLEQPWLFWSRYTKSFLIVVTIATPVFFYFAQDVSFNTDMSKLNFMTAETRAAQLRLETITQASLSSVYVVAIGGTLEAALRKTEQTVPVLKQLKSERTVSKFSSVSTFLISDSLQRVRIQKWNSFWTPERKANSIAAVNKEGTALKFSPLVLNNFQILINKEYQVMDTEASSIIRNAFFDDYIIDKDSVVTVVSLVKVSSEKRQDVYHALASSPVHAFDKQMLTNLFVEYVHNDFNFIVMFTAILVFVALFISYGRIELTIITFAPMFITWIWILGIMALLHIEFNIINVMVSTFIFGLGDDYSIFIMDGLQQECRVGKKNLDSIRTSIVLSALTTIAGLGVLIFAQHPALRSIAAIAIIGIVCVVIMSQTIEPYLFQLLITNRTRKGLAPMTWVGILRTFFTYSFFVVGALLLTVTGFIFRMIPFARKQLKYIYHSMIRFITWVLIYIEPNVSKNIIGRSNQTFASPKVIIANHSSFLDILLTTMLHPKLILLTNKWVWDSPIFGGVARMADYYPVTEGADDSIARLQKLVLDGYSVGVFPEGKRSDDGTINRFHKGAFYLAESLQVPIQPLLIHGAADAIPKGSYYLNEGQLTLKFLAPIAWDDASFGHSYAERTKGISKYFKEQHHALSEQLKTPAYFAHRLVTNYLYKGPVLEWYLRVKVRLEKNYQVFHDVLPLHGTILDLGCGYGFLCYMLSMLSEDRILVGVDYDEEKIETARHGYLKQDRINFHACDVMQFALTRYDAIVISDVLHYLSKADQEILLIKCFDALLPGGKMMMRDGNADLKERHGGTQLTEFFSVNVLKFNKATQSLNFISGDLITALAREHGLLVTVVDDAKYTSNVIFIFEKQG